MKSLTGLLHSALVIGGFTFVIAGCEPSMYYNPNAPDDASQSNAQQVSIQSEPTAQTAAVELSDREAARQICVEGSMAECQAACDGGRLAMCVTLAQELHSGARVPADPERADRVLAQACNGGKLDACLQRGIWLESSDVDEAADLFMRGCEARRTDSITTTVSCGLWMSLLDAHVYEPNDGDRYAGLFRVCTLEEKGALVPGSTLNDGTLSLHYVGGACGRLKDLGMSSGAPPSNVATMTANAPNPFAPKW